MLKLNIRSDIYSMPEFGLYRKNTPSSHLNFKLEKGWEKPTLEKEQNFIDTKTLAKEFQYMKKENTELKNRLEKIEVELS